jgi:chromosome segregation ATPase
MQDAVRQKLNSVLPPKDGPPSPQQQRRTELQNKLKEIRAEQAGSKNGRNQVFDQIKKLDEQLKSRIAEQKAARSRVAFKNVEEIDAQIDRLQKQVDGGMMKLVDEKKALAEVSSLRKTRKNFSAFDDQQKAIDELKAKIKTLRDSLDDPVAKARSEEYNKLQAELDQIKAEQDENFKNLNAIRDERTKLHAEQQAKYKALRDVEQKIWEEKKAWERHEYELRQKTRERKKAEQEAYQNAKRRERAEKMLAEASEPAYLDEIRRAQGLINYFDPSAAPEAKPLVAASGLTAEPTRTVDDAAFKGMKVVKKEEEDYFAGSGSKRGKKGKKGTASPAAATAKGFSVPPAVLEDCAAMGIDPPMSAADIPAVTEKVKAKLAHWKSDQKAQTERNIAKAKKELERLDAEESGASTPKEKANGAAKTVTETVTETVAAAAETIKDTVAEVAEKVKEVTVGETKEE